MQIISYSFDFKGMLLLLDIIAVDLEYFSMGIKYYFLLAYVDLFVIHGGFFSGGMASLVKIVFFSLKWLQLFFYELKYVF